MPPDEQFERDLVPLLGEPNKQVGVIHTRRVRRPDRPSECGIQRHRGTRKLACHKKEPRAAKRLPWNPKKFIDNGDLGASFYRDCTNTVPSAGIVSSRSINEIRIAKLAGKLGRKGD